MGAANGTGRVRETAQSRVHSSRLFLTILGIHAPLLAL